MKRLLKVLGIGAGIILAVFIVISLVVRYYLTDERAEAILIPRLQEALGRQVELERLQVSLLRGIRISNFAVKEEDGRTDFFRAEEFVLSYELLPLLRGRLIISEARLLQPSIRVVRDARGRLNYQTLAFLQQPPEPEPRRQEEVVVLPLALTIDQVAISRGRVVFEDQLRRIPGLEALVNASISVRAADGTRQLIYHGRYDLAADLDAEPARAHLSGHGELSPDSVTFTLTGAVDGQELHLEGAVHDWRQTPRVQLDLSSEHLEAEPLLELLGSLTPGPTPAPPQGAEAGGAPEPSPAATPAPFSPELQPIASDSAPGAPSPAGLSAAGRLRVARLLAAGLEMRDLSATYAFDQGVLRISELNTRAADGLITGTGQVDLNQPAPAFAGSLRLTELQAGQLAALFSERYGDWLTGTLRSSLQFSGQGTEWQQIREVLTAVAEFTLRDGSLREFPVTAAVAELLGLPRLRSISYHQLTGSARVEEGRVLLDSTLSATDLRIETSGTIGLDGRLDLPVALHFLGSLAEEIRGRAPLARYLARTEDGVVINLRLTGTVTSPRPALDAEAVGEQLREKVEEKVQREVERFLKRGEEGLPPPAQDMLKELLRKN